MTVPPCRADDLGVVSPGPRGAVGDADKRSDYRLAGRNARQLEAAGLHNVDARIRRHRPGQHCTSPVREDGLYDIDEMGVFLGLEVGKSAHHGHGLTRAGKKVFDKQLPNSEPKLRAVFDKPAAKFGSVHVVVDQPASIGALPLTVARDTGCKVAYLRGLAMRRIADLYPRSRRRRSASVRSPRPVTQEPTIQWATWVRSAPAMPPSQPRLCRWLVMRSPEEHRVQARYLHTEFAGGPRWKHEQSLLQLVPGPTLTAVRAGEFSLPLPPPALRAVNTHGPHAQCHRHDARRQSFPFEHTDGSIRRARQTWDIAIPHPGASPAAFPRPKRGW